MSFNFSNPYPSTRLPVFARNVVSTSHPLAAQAGLRMLWQGGNAVDAAIAAAAVMTICEPVSNGLGSDAFCILWDGKQLQGLNASGRSPRGWTPDYFAKLGPKPERGANSVTIPGAVSAWRAKQAADVDFQFVPAVFNPQFKTLVDRTIGGVMKSGEIEKIYAKWFTSAIPPRGVNLNFQITPAIREAFKNPNDRGVQ